MSGFYHLPERTVHHDWDQAAISCNASTYYGFGINELVRALSPLLSVFHVRRAEAVVNSILLKNWYSEPLFYEEFSRPGLQPSVTLFFHRPFGWILPKGGVEEWRKMMHAGRISWFCAEIVKEIHDRLTENSQVENWTFRLEDMDRNYNAYLWFAEVLHLEPVIPERKFLALKGIIKKRGKGRHSNGGWSIREKVNFESRIGSYFDIHYGIKPPLP